MSRTRDKWQKVNRNFSYFLVLWNCSYSVVYILFLRFVSHNHFCLDFVEIYLLNILYLKSE